MATELPELDHSTFDLAKALSGIDYPRDTFPVWLDAASAYNLTKANRELDLLDKDDSDEYKVAAGKAQALLEKVKASEWKVTVQGVPNHLLEANTKLLTEKFDLQPGSLITGDAYLYRQAQRWATYIVNVETADGKTFRPSIEQAEQLWGALPDYARDQIEDCIDRLSGGEKGGFEIAAQDVDFLSDPSPEA